MNLRTIVLALLIFSISLSTAFGQEEKKCEWHAQKNPELCGYEPTTIGWTKDSDDSGFMDFKVSVRYQLIPDWSTKGLNALHKGIGGNSALYFAFTGRFGQYIGTRDSSPVIGKRYNPKIFYRYWTDPDHVEYVDFSLLAHESNGQSIDSPEEYQAAVKSSKRPEFANDELSRGWDYLEVIWKKNLKYVKDQRALSTYVTLKYFLPYGPLQGRAEDYHAWENLPDGKQRSHVNGVAGMIKYYEEGDGTIISGIKIAALFETGYRELFRYNTFRLEVGTKLFQLPVMLWGQTGYGSDLAQYYKKVDSYGIAAEIGSF